MLHGATVAILSGGPSAIDHFARGQAFMDELEEYETLIAVNHNAEKVEADWWVFNDHPVFPSTRTRGRPVVFGRSDWTPARMAPRTEDWRLWPRVHQDDCHDQIPRVAPDGPVPVYNEPKYANYVNRPERRSNLPRWNAFGGLSALGLAWLLKPESVALYGYDNAGTTGVNDADHPDVPRNRDPRRWETEAKIFAWYMKIFAEARISVARI